MQKQTIQELTKQARESIVKAGYAQGTISTCCSVWRMFEKYAAEKGELEFSQDFGEKFLFDHYGISSFSRLSRCRQAYVRAIHMLNEVRQHGYILPRRALKGYVFPDEFRDIIERFIKYRESQGIVPTSIQITKLYLERFSEYLVSHYISSLDMVDMKVIDGFVRSLAAYGKPTINHTLRSVRGLLRYAYDTGFIKVDQSKIVPRVKYNRRARIPSAYTADEISRLLAAVDRSNPLGKRNYVFLLLASRLGLRASDICNLSFENIKWEENRIEIVQQKTGKTLILPLVEEVGIALIDYLKNGRPTTDCKHVLVRHVYPFDKFKPSSLYTVVNRYFEKSGIPMKPGKKRGPHALRHSLASSLLEEKVPLPVISEVLGHADTNTTGVYLKIDIANLRKCAISVPFYVVNGEAEVQYVEN